MQFRTFPETITKSELLRFYGLSRYLLKRALGEEVLKKTRFSERRVFGKADTALIFRRMEPEVFESFIQTKEEMYMEYLKSSFHQTKHV